MILVFDKPPMKEVVVIVKNMHEGFKTMYFDGACSRFGAGAGVIFVSPVITPFHIHFQSTMWRSGFDHPFLTTSETSIFLKMIGIVNFLNSLNATASH